MHPSTPEHTQRIRNELKKAGATKWGMLKLESRRLPHIIHPDEEIGAAVYGRYKNGSAMLIATDRRVIFLDRKPGYTMSDELTYDVVSGVSKNTSGLFSSVVLHTRLGDYGVRFVNLRAASNFEHYIEQRVLEHTNGKTSPPKESPQQEPPLEAPEKPSNTFFTDNARDFLKTSEIAVFSTVDADTNAYGAVVYYISDQYDNIYILTKTETTKTHNVFHKHGVAITVFDADTLRTLQIQGKADIEADQSVKDQVFKELARARKYGGETRKPPVTQLNAGSYIIIRITPTAAKFHDFKADSKK